MARRSVHLTDAQWTKIEPLLQRTPRTQRGGRPGASHRVVVDDLLWVLQLGARWRDLPAEYPSPSTCWRRLKRWDQDVCLLSTYRHCWVGERTIAWVRACQRLLVRYERSTRVFLSVS